MTPSPLEFLVPLEALESWSGVLPFVVLAVVLANLVTRALAHRHVEKGAKAGDDDEEISRYVPHELSNAALVMVSFAYMVIHPHGGMVLSILVLGMVTSDLFEYESRRVEARNGLEIERPKSSLVASVLVVMYAAYQSLFYLVAPVWNAVI